MICKSCGAELKEHAKFCENCGAPTDVQQPDGTERTAAEEPKKSIFSKLKIIITALFLVIAVVAFVRSLNPDNNILGIDNMRDAYDLAQEVVLDNLLLNTANVSFPKFDADYVTQGIEKITYEGQEYRIYTVSSYVDFENLFGATVRVDYVIDIGLPIDGDQDLYYFDIVSFD